MAAVCVFAFLRGDRPEKRTAIVLGLALAASTLLQRREIGHYEQWGLLTVDAMYLAWLTPLVLFSDRYWPLFAAAFQLLLVATHLVMIISYRSGQWTYMTAYAAWSYGGFISLGAGTLIENQRKRPIEEVH